MAYDVTTLGTPPPALKRVAGGDSTRWAEQPPPKKPRPGACCEGDCKRLWDVYYDKLDAYEKLVAERTRGK
ncbi:unnamed protein product [Spirodela intermedia]|uniref:Uncharacterized protein n=1 Tax=Spirodela intermedia TaxID=51605 RepID=A0A7I8KS74_SPIIN|nr:unnamed protein product [Spirodela intermedia]